VAAPLFGDITDLRKRAQHQALGYDSYIRKNVLFLQKRDLHGAGWLVEEPPVFFQTWPTFLNVVDVSGGPLP
jgi:hypothetical protein